MLQRQAVTHINQAEHPILKLSWIMEGIVLSDTEMKEDMLCVSVERHFSSFMRAPTE